MKAFKNGVNPAAPINATSPINEYGRIKTPTTNEQIDPAINTPLIAVENDLR
jgi:hypothetical protein